MQLQSTLSDAEGMLSDFTRALSGYIDAFSYDEQEFSEVSDRLDLINHLKMKYGRTIEDILSYRDARQQELDRLSNFDAYVSGLKAEAENAAPGTDPPTYILVAHNGIARFVKSYFRDMTNEEFASFGVGNCEVCRFDF